MSHGRCGGGALDVVELSELEVRCVVGVYRHERERAQPLSVRLQAHLELRPAGDTDEVAATVDYGRLAGEVRFLLEHARFRLIEAAAETIARYLLLPPTADAPRPQVQRAVVRIDKPEALRGLARPAVTITRSLDDVTARVEQTSFGLVEALHHSRDVTVSRVRLSPGQRIPTHVHRDSDEAELTLGDRLETQGRWLPWGTAVAWPRALAHAWNNPSTVEQTLLRVARPHALDEPSAAPAESLQLPASTDFAPAGTRA